MPKAAIKTIFFQGQYQTLVDKWIEGRKNLRRTDVDNAYLVGSLVFVGRRRDAEMFSFQYVGTSNKEAKVIARFFLAIGACRDSDYALALSLLKDNWRERRFLEKGSEAMHFLYQGFGFFRNFCCRYKKSYLWSLKSWDIAFQSQFTYGCLLSADLMGHNLIHLGAISRGLKSLELAKKYSRRLGHEGIENAHTISIACYRVQHGQARDPENLLKRLLRVLKIDDTYSKSNLLLEYLRLLLLKGQYHEAERLLPEAEIAITKQGHRRQIAGLHFRVAYMLYLKGEPTGAIQRLGLGLGLLDPAVDLLHQAEILGLLCRIRAETGEINRLEQDRLMAITKKMGRQISSRILFRQKLSVSDEIQEPLGDHIGQLIDSLNRSPALLSHLGVVVKNRYLGLLRLYLPRPCPSNYFLMDLVPKALVVFSAGQVWMSPIPLTVMTRTLLSRISRERLSKEQIVELLWGYRYESLRHDSVLYTSVYRLRRLLGPFQGIIEADAFGYGLNESAAAKIFERVTDLSGIGENVPKAQYDLNIRQLRVLEFLKKNESINISAHADFQKISKASATRDLSELAERRILRRVGRARATVYVLA